jgi:hypothetical protein
VTSLCIHTGVIEALMGQRNVPGGTVGTRVGGDSSDEHCDVHWITAISSVVVFLLD